MIVDVRICDMEMFVDRKRSECWVIGETLFLDWKAHPCS